LDWKITAVEYPQSLNVEYKETGRAANQVDYDLTVKLKKDAPAGYFKDQIVVLTDDAAQARLFVPVEGNVAASIALTSPLLVGVLAPGATATRSLVVRNKTPFRVLGVQCADPRFTFNLPDGAAALQKIGVNFKATGAIGAVTQKITIETDAPGGEALEATVQARITPWGAKDAVSAEATPFVPQSL
jgi:hypothetical protein